ncbi:hypothetical protein J22TS1_26640 [Siminovitchia terrae]|nr:hypothetical protein J22TS1_26640 [Siminovitchia terrae]
MDINVRTFMFTDDGEMPNNADFPVIVYEGRARKGLKRLLLGIIGPMAGRETYSVSPLSQQYP